jgi:transcriptional regulator with XRE-family HTH domain
VQLGNRIRELREEAGLNREQMAQATGVSVRAVVQWELGEREPGWFNMLALAEALRVDCTAFIQAPAERSSPGPGRPRKGAATTPAPKRPRGRPSKAAGAAQEATPEGQADQPSRQKKGRAKTGEG